MISFLRVTSTLLGLLTATTLVLSTDGAAYAQPAPATPKAGPARSNFVIQIRGRAGYLSDSVSGALLEHDGPTWDLFITGAQQKSQFTCQVRSTDRQFLAELQRTILDVPSVTVSCANALESARGGAMVDLDDPKGGSLVIGGSRR